MWVRIASRYDVWYEPAVLAQYRRHAGGETARLRAAGEIASDVVATIEVLSSSLPASKRASWTSKSYRRLVKSHLRRASKLLGGKSHLQALEHLSSARIVVSMLPKGLATRWLQRRLRNLELKVATIAPQTDR